MCVPCIFSLDLCTFVLFSLLFFCPFSFYNISFTQDITPWAFTRKLFRLFPSFISSNSNKNAFSNSLPHNQLFWEVFSIPRTFLMICAAVSTVTQPTTLSASVFQYLSSNSTTLHLQMLPDIVCLIVLEDRYVRRHTGMTKQSFCVIWHWTAFPTGCNHTVPIELALSWWQMNKKSFCSWCCLSNRIKTFFSDL